ncbi:hypothetical protein [Arthrobacter sp. ISL-28]|uniref:hypothetical protein n=1 Tax=Arthrobacter sp. ISL-28 TaxID=2819108 RepID=UPI001BEBBDAF|nr:hypothetical protein [Arthrobacter sp. ISL-28]MBT2522593.1 hypothetical protein [Arthrobacter sp. ISL-28]
MPTAATALVFIPALLSDPSTTEAVPGGWLATLLLAGPLTAYFASRLSGKPLDATASLLVGLPQLPLILLLSTARIWIDVQRGHLLAGSGEDAMAYVIGTPLAFVAGTILMTLVAAAARLGARSSK